MEKERTHRKAPWSYHRDPSRKRGQISIIAFNDNDPAPVTIGWVRSGRKESLANAALMASSPDMKPALENLLAYVEETAGAGYHVDLGSIPEVVAARDAIKKSNDF